VPTIPFAWADVITSVDGFLSAGLVTGALTAILALIFVPRFIRAVKGIVGRR